MLESEVTRSITHYRLINLLLYVVLDYLSDVEKIQAGIGDKVAVFIQYFTTFIAGYAIAFAISWKLALVTATVLPLMSTLGAILAKVSEEKVHVHGFEL